VDGGSGTQTPKRDGFLRRHRDCDHGGHTAQLHLTQSDKGTLLECRHQWHCRRPGHDRDDEHDRAGGGNGKFTVTGGLRWLGWATTIVMGICVVVMGLTWVV